MGVTYIYAIRCLETDKFIYVGKSNEPRRRFKDHIYRSDNDCICKWIKECGGDGFQVEYLEKVKFKTSSDWIERERFWIAKLGQENHPLCNKNDGGAGTSEHTEEAKAKMRGRTAWNKGKSPSKETCRKLSVALSGENSQWYGVTGENHPAYGYRHTEAALAKICVASSGENHPRGFQGKRRPEEWKQNHSKFLRQWHKIHESPTAKLYPAFYNIRTRAFVPSGINLTKMCRENELPINPMMWLKHGRIKQTKDGWWLATESEIACFSEI